jgi:senataxin
LSSIPSDFLPMNNSSNTRGMNFSNNTRNMRASGPRPMHFSMLSEPRIGMRSGEDDQSNSFPRNGSYRNPDVRPGDRSGENLQFGTTRRPNASNDPRRQV